MGYLSEKFKNVGVPFMEDNEKGEMQELENQSLTLIDYGFIKEDKSDYAVLKFAEKPGKFYFAGLVLTQNLHEAEADLGSKKRVLNEFKNTFIKFSKQINKAGKYEYWAVEYIDKQQELHDGEIPQVEG